MENVSIITAVPDLDLRDSGWSKSIGKEYYETFIGDVVKIGDVVTDELVLSFTPDNYIDTTYFERTSLHAGDVITFTFDTFDVAIFISEVVGDSKLKYDLTKKPPTYYMTEPFSSVKDTKGVCYSIKSARLEGTDYVSKIMPFLNYNTAIVPSNGSEYFASMGENLRYFGSSFNPCLRSDATSEVTLPKEIIKKTDSNRICDVNCFVYGLFSIYRTSKQIQTSFQCLNFDICFETTFKYTNTPSGDAPNLSFGNLEYWKDSSELQFVYSDQSWFYLGGGLYETNRDRNFAAESFRIYSPYFFTDQKL